MRTFINFSMILVLCALAAPPAYSQRSRTEQDLEGRMQHMRGLEKKMETLEKRDNRTTLVEPPLTDSVRERIVKFRHIADADLVKYNVFLMEKGTGMFRLFPDSDCVGSAYIRIDGPCATFVPESSSFSFREKLYSHKDYHDIGYRADRIYTNAFFSQGIIVPLGDVPIAEVNLTHEGLKHLLDFKPDQQTSAARQTATLYSRGVDFGKYRYGSSTPAVANTTYVVRIIAYKLANGIPPLTEKSSSIEQRFHSFQRDKREDAVFAFRIVRKTADGGVTLVWKELDRKAAPKLKFGKAEPLGDFKTESATPWN